ncbi:MAG: zinc ABC transporter substrate-binding protein, partial [Cellvibrionaceae bacterium]|nr:zinc ABC transporter substrate-binding protein [Cellvibrionaceae bacterium]
LLFCLSTNAYAATPSVAVDIAPLHSLVSQVMDGVGQPKLLIPAEASPHHYTLRPSEAKALADADLVFWVGERLTPWLAKALDNLADSAQKIPVLDIAGTTTHAFREGATFESHDHDEEKHHDEEAHHKDEHHEKDEHASDDEHQDDHHHDREGNDPHAWLDPENAKLWVAHISDVLSKRDPENASLYGRNAAKAITSLDLLIASTGSKIDALNKPQFIVFHDAYQYFEKRFNISAAGSIALGDAEDPSPARIKEVRATVKRLGVSCVFTEPQYNPGLVKNVFAGTGIATIGVMDPLGAHIAPVSQHYRELIQGMTSSLSQCQ